MGTSQLKSTLLMLLVSVLTFTVAVGCGDSKSKKRQPFNKSVDSNKVTDDGQTGSAADEDSEEDGGDTAAGEEEGGGGGGDDTTRTQTSEELENVENAYMDLRNPEGATQLVNKNDIPDGNFKLDKVIIYSKWQAMEAGKDLRVLHTNQRTDGTDGSVSLVNVNEEQAGSFADLDDQLRKMEIPVSISVRKAEGRFAPASREAFTPGILQMKLSAEGRSEVQLDLANASSPSSVPASVANAILAAETNFKMTDKGLEMPIEIKKSGDQLLILIEVLESQMNPIKIRQIILVYEPDNSLHTTVTGGAGQLPEDPEVAEAEGQQ